MNRPMDEWIKAGIKAEAEQINLSEEQSNKIFANIQIENNNRRNIRMISKGKKVFIAVAAIVVLGTMTAIGAGKAVGYLSSINTEMVDYANAAELKQAEETMGAQPKAPQVFSNGLSFKNGYLGMVDGIDENGRVIESYPNIYIDYDNFISMNISRPIHQEKSSTAPAEVKEVQGVRLEARSAEYLFLPPDATPSDEDMRLEEEGKLHIAYGSEEEQRDTFRSVSWTEDGLSYLLSSFNHDYSISDLLAMAEEVVMSK